MYRVCVERKIMKKFVTPEGIEKRQDYYYYTGCDCIGEEHGIVLWFNTEYGLDIVIETNKWANNFWDRIRFAFKMVFTGHLDSSGEVCLRNAQHARDIATVLNHLADEMKK